MGGFPTMAPGDRAGPGDGIILIPVFAEIPIVFVVYTIALLYLRPSTKPLRLALTVLS